MIKVLYMNISVLEDHAVFNKAFSMISTDRKKKIMNFKNITPSRLSLGAGVLLHIALKEYGLSEYLDSLKYGKHGKPYLENQNFFFNLSHSGEYVICAYGTAPIGIDIQKIKNPVKYTNRILSEEEKTYFFSIDESLKTDVFYRLWVRKESLIKWDGRGLQLPLNELTFVSNHEISNTFMFENKRLYFNEYDCLLPEYAICVCSEENNHNKNIVEITSEFLTKY